MTTTAGDDRTYFVSNRGLSNKPAAVLMVLCLVMYWGGFFVSAWVFVVGLIGPVVVVTLWSSSLYNGVKLTSEELYVGIDRLDLRQLDRTFGVQYAEDALSNSTIATLQLGFSSTRMDEQLRILGGSWGTGSIAGELIVLCDAITGQQLLLLTKRRDEFKRALVSALEALPPGDAPDPSITSGTPTKALAQFFGFVLLVVLYMLGPFIIAELFFL